MLVIHNLNLDFITLVRIFVISIFISKTLYDPAPIV